jgi:hypothetical protein
MEQHVQISHQSQVVIIAHVQQIFMELIARQNLLKPHVSQQTQV